MEPTKQPRRPGYTFDFSNNLLRIVAAIVACSVMLLSLNGCTLPFRFLTKSFAHLSDDIAPVQCISPTLLDNPGLSVLWIGHASVLIQIHDKVIITDPSFTSTVGMFSRRLIAPGIDPSTLSHVDVTLISHLHFDHFSYASLDMLPKSGTVIIPPDGAEYTPELGFADTRESVAWQPMEINGVRITPVPVKHFGGRYGLDMLWATTGYTGYVIEYQGITVLFTGDTGYDPDLFVEIGKRFHIDLALIPIAPIEPHEMMRHVHADPLEALKIFKEVNAKWMVPIHHSTFDQGFDPSPHYPKDVLKVLVDKAGLNDRVAVLDVGERKLFMH